ncbi:uncharacterized protein G2W53_024078 [Senna tora]|uniref:Uncharacterized protein n=1 Tax=Senna tora TaxID=362788 RepID=A0A834TAL2_9FABA|nr:uncharacterized protein G2W53_024078 [Senna tora]
MQMQSDDCSEDRVVTETGCVMTVGATCNDPIEWRMMRVMRQKDTGGHKREGEWGPRVREAAGKVIMRVSVSMDI